jgi:tetratricopeptide (TPR) repeat protein
MDCRRSWLVALGLAGAVVGCGPDRAQQVNPEPPLAAKVKQASDGPKQKPKAATCVAAGDMYQQQADDADCTPLRQQQLRDMARRAYQQALVTEPNDVGASRALAGLYEKVDEHDKAVAAYRKALKAHPKEASLWHELGLCLAKHKEWQPALECLQTAAKLDPENRQYTNAHAYALARSGHMDESYACFERTVGEAKAHYNVARMLHHMNQDNLCRQHLQLALTADPQLTPAREMLAQLEAGQSATATE